MVPLSMLSSSYEKKPTQDVHLDDWQVSQPRRCVKAQSTRRADLQLRPAHRWKCSEPFFLYRGLLGAILKQQLALLANTSKLVYFPARNRPLKCILAASTSSPRNRVKLASAGAYACYLKFGKLWAARCRILERITGRNVESDEGLRKTTPIGPHRWLEKFPRIDIWHNTSCMENVLQRLDYA